MAPPFPQLHYDINQSGNISGQKSQSKGSLGDIFIKTELLFFYIRRLSLIKVMATFFSAVVFVCSCGEVVAAFLVVTH